MWKTNIFHTELRIFLEPGERSLYRDSLRAERSADRITLYARFSAPVQKISEARPASYTMGTGIFLEVKRPMRGFDHSPHVAPMLKKEYSYISTPPLGFGGLY